MVEHDLAVRRFLAAEKAVLASYKLAGEERYLDLANSKVRVRVWSFGDGPTALLLPGLGAVAAAWAPLMARLHGLRLVALDRPGCGLSDPLDLQGMDLRRYSVNLVESLVEALGEEKVSLIGNSIGGTMALWFATEHPEHVERVVLLGSTPFMLDHQAPFGMRLMSLSFIARKALAQSSAEAIDQTFMRMGHPSGVVHGEMLDLFMAARQLPGYADGFIGLLQSAIGFWGRRVEVPAEELSKLVCPTLMIWGRNDTHGPVQLGERVARTMLQAKLEVVGVGHLPWLDDAAECARLTQDFLARD